MSAATRVTVVARRHPDDRLSPLVPELVAALRALGCTVDRVDPDAGHHDLARIEVTSDLYVVKSGTEAALSYAGALHAQGALVLNPYPVAVACRDKIVQTRLLQRAGVLLPDSWLTTDPCSLLAELDAGPLILKDPRGSQGRGLAVVHDPAELRALAAGTPWLAMRYHEPEGEDLKLYRIGDDVFGVERVFPARTYAEKVGRPFAPAGHLRETVLRCGDAFGITVYGVDVVRSAGRHWVVDMSSFPGFKGVPEAGRRIAVEALSAAAGREVAACASSS